MSHPTSTFTGSEAEVKHESARRTRRSFLVGGAAAAAGYGVWRVLQTGTEIGHQPPAFRRTFQTDAAISRGVFDERGLAPTYPLSAATELRLNGNVGMGDTLELASWRLQVAGTRSPQTHPRYAADVTAWNYRYTGDMEPDRQADDVKDAPGNGDPIPPDPSLVNGSDRMSVSKTGAPTVQRSKDPAGNNGAAASPKPMPQKQEPGAGSGSGLPATPTLAERFDALNRAVHHKRNLGDEEAGPSASSLDIGTPGLLLTMADLAALPFVEHVTQFKCIEGWSQIVHWGGYRLRDFIDAYPPGPVDGKTPRFVYMETPDGNYYGGYNMSAARHPQSLLVTHMHGKPLTQEHGAPLRLFMPIKYGYKNLKRIGLISYTDTKPDDYWTKLGYDWYAGL